MRNIEKDRFNFKYLTEAISSIHKHFYHQSVTYQIKPQKLLESFSFSHFTNFG